MAGQLQQRRLGGAVMKRALLSRGRIEAPIGRDLAIHGGDVDDAGFARRRGGVLQRRQRRAHGFEGGGDGAFIGRGEIGRLQRRKAFHLHRDGIVDQDVQTRRGFRKSRAPPPVSATSKAARSTENPSPRNCSSNSGQFGVVAAIDDHMGAGPGQGPRHRRAQMSPRRRNEGGAAVETERLGVVHCGRSASSSQERSHPYGKKPIYAAVQHEPRRLAAPRPIGNRGSPH